MRHPLYALSCAACSMRALTRSIDTQCAWCCRQLQQTRRALDELAGALGQAPDPLPVLQAVEALQAALAGPGAT